MLQLLIVDSYGVELRTRLLFVVGVEFTSVNFFLLPNALVYSV